NAEGRYCFTVATFRYARRADGLVTGQFFPQCCESFVGCQRTGIVDLSLLITRGVRCCAGIRWFGCSNFCCFCHMTGNLFFVSFPTCLGVSVLLLPCGAFCFEAFHPFIGFRIEAFWVFVVAFFIVVGSHTVERWVEVGAFWVHAFVSLFEDRKSVV